MRTSAVGTGVTEQEIPFLFPIIVNTDLEVVARVTATGVETPLVLGDDYTVTIDDDGTGTVTMIGDGTGNDNIATTSEVWISRNTPRTQTLDLAQGGNFNAENLEDALDRATKQIIENTDNISRSLVAPVTDDDSLDMELPNSVDRADQYLAFDTNGEPTVVASVAPATATTTAWSELFLAEANGADAQTRLGITTFAKSMLDDLTAPAVLSTLGVTDYIQTLLDDATAAEARATLEISNDELYDPILSYENQVLCYENNVLTWNT
jgi:hypothetical protein